MYLNIKEALKEYKGLDAGDLSACDDFFGRWCPGNTLDSTDRPFERFSDYENLLVILNECDSDKYKRLHKGTPFYFMCWLAFDMKNYEKALFYLDAGISEDIKNQESVWRDRPGSYILFLNIPDRQVAKRVVEKLIKTLDNEIARFNSINKSCITKESIVEKFVKNLIQNNKGNRTIVTAFYTFLLEFEDRHTDLLLRSEEGGSIEPFLTHLFKGGLIFESILKNVYPKYAFKTLGNISSGIKDDTDFGFTVSTTAFSISEILAEINKQPNGIEIAFNTTAKIRNTTGHNLVWGDNFNDPENYKKLYEQQVNAILYLIEKKYISP